MRNSIKRLVDEIKVDKDLTPYFVDYIGENVKMNIERNLSTPTGGFVEMANSKLSVLIDKLETKVPKQYTNTVVDEVCRYYAAFVFLTKA